MRSKSTWLKSVCPILPPSSRPVLDGQRGGTIKVRAKIEKLDNKTLVIRDIPYSKTSETLIDSITRAVEKGKIKVRKVEDLTAANVEILVHLSRLGK